MTDSTRLPAARTRNTIKSRSMTSTVVRGTSNRPGKEVLRGEGQQRDHTRQASGAGPDVGRLPLGIDGSSAHSLDAVIGSACCRPCARPAGPHFLLQLGGSAPTSVLTLALFSATLARRRQPKIRGVDKEDSAFGMHATTRRLSDGRGCLWKSV